MREGAADLEARLGSAGLVDPAGAAAALRRMAAGAEEEEALASLLPRLLPALAGIAAPDSVLVSLERFSQSVRGRFDLYRDLAEHPRWLEILLTLFAGSQFLTEILLLQPDLFMRLVLPRKLAAKKSAARILQEARSALRQGGVDEQLDILRRFQRLEYLRIGASDLLGLFDLGTVTEELSNLADGVIAASVDVAARESGADPSDFAVVAMGKLGGRELNYSSDIDLLFLSRANAPAQWGLAKKLIDVLARATNAGFLYRVDMRLRPWGDAGPLVSSVDSYLAYLSAHARLWEKQALLKARVVAGDPSVGDECLALAAPLLFSTAPEAARAEVRAMRQMTERDVRKKGLEKSEVKLGEGSIRDIEFVVQFLQLAHGGRLPRVRTGNTLEATRRLAAEGILPPDEERVLRDGYVFLRTIEHHLQVMHYQQTHVLPSEPRAMAELARRLGFAGDDAGETFRARYREHGDAIRAIYVRHLVEEPAARPAGTADEPDPLSVAHVARMDPSYRETFDAGEIEEHVRMAAGLDSAHTAAVGAAPSPDGGWRVTIVAWDSPGELSIICGLLFAGGYSIRQAEAFTYEAADGAAAARPVRRKARGAEEAPGRWRRQVPAKGARPDDRKKTVDVFTVVRVRETGEPEDWDRFAADLGSLFRLVRSGRQAEARAEIARRAASAAPAGGAVATPLAPVEIEIDNDSSPRYTVLRIDAPDTAGFLYELTNALSLNGVDISRMTAGSAGTRVRDTLWVTDSRGAKITSAERQRELRAATVLIKHFTHLLPGSPNPHLALRHFGELLGQLLARPDWPRELATLESPRVLDTLARLLGVSDFLWSDFLRMQHANLFPLVQDAGAVSVARPRADLEREFGEVLRPGGWREPLNALKDRELFRIDMRYILGKTGLEEFSGELTDLAEVMIGAAHRLVEEEMEEAYGTPRLRSSAPCRFAVLALGKCGGRELGFASDIEVLFVYDGEGETSGPERIGTPELYEKTVQAFVGAVRSKKEGVFELDLRLRPYGAKGSMAVSLDAFRRYFAKGGPAWPYERQSLIRLRPIAGDASLGSEVERLRDELVYDGAPPDAASVRAMRERQVRQLVTGGTFNLKFSPGGLVDVEYLVQSLQIRHGQGDPSLRTPNTRDAIEALSRAGILPPADRDELVEAQTAIRKLIEALRVVRGHATDVAMPSPGSEELASLARRLPGGPDPAAVWEGLRAASAAVREISSRLLA
jgi:[glutamine synthetase] adenylyltransferase / [glutamine synthetase]-adenylyl-L-tyrosine phosphorylase